MAHERELFVQYRQTGERAVRNDLAERHRGLAVSLARRFNGRGEPLDDLLQVAMIALLRAIERFEPERGNSFTTFATPTILGELRRHFRDHTWALKVPRPIKDLHLRVRPAVAELRVELGRAPFVPELAQHLDCTDEEIIQALEVSAAYRPTSLHAVGRNGEGLTLEDRLASEGDPLGSFEAVETVRALMGRLPERERTVLHLRFYDELSQSEIAERVGLSQMHVSRILRATLERLSHLPGVKEG
ncbi:MAG: SigB/SigF/SigG family RNA polymerase sigma factor [Acidimicrobiales bacterium]